MKNLFLLGITLVGLTMCQYAPAQTTINLPDGSTSTCWTSGKNIYCQ